MPGRTLSHAGPPSHLLSVFPKRWRLLGLFRFLHGGLFSLQLLSNLLQLLIRLGHFFKIIGGQLRRDLELMKSGQYCKHCSLGLAVETRFPLEVMFWINTFLQVLVLGC